MYGTMKTLKLAVLTVCFISVIATRVLDSSIYKPESVIYTTENDIIDMHCSMVNPDSLFIVERKLPNDDFKGLYALKTDQHIDKLISTKVLDNGKCTTSDNATIFFGASNGIYTYNFETRKAEKYGTVTADIKAVQKDRNKDVIYVIADNQLNKVTEKGTKIRKIKLVNDVEEIVLDTDNNLFLYEKLSGVHSSGVKYRKAKVLVGDNVVEITGLPDKYDGGSVFEGSSSIADHQNKSWYTLHRFN